MAKQRITDDAAGYKILLDVLAEHGDTPQTPIPVAIETSHGLLVATLQTGARQIYAVNPLSAARYRDRHAVSGKKSDHGDALVLANILRTDMAAHRPLPRDSELARAITVLARAQQDAVWARQQIANQVRSLRRYYYPAALQAFLGKQNGLTREVARAILTTAPTPARAAKLTTTQLQSALRRSGRSRGIEAEAARIKEIFRGTYARHPQPVEDAMGLQLSSLLLQLDAACTAAGRLAQAVEEAFLQHPDAQILLSFPGLGVQLGARILAEVGDDPTGFVDARGLKAYAGSAPITRASGKKSHVGRRYIKNHRLMNTGFLWAFAPSNAPRAPTNTTDDAAQPATGMQLPNATSSTDSSASSTTAFKAGTYSTSIRPSPLPPDQNSIPEPKTLLRPGSVVMLCCRTAPMNRWRLT